MFLHRCDAPFIGITAIKPFLKTALPVEHYPCIKQCGNRIIAPDIKKLFAGNILAIGEKLHMLI
jgi:hypothetical protein